MLKKILTVAFASAFAFALYSPSAMACGGKDKSVAKEEKKEAPKKTADKKKKSDKKKSTKKESGKKVSRR